MKREVCQGFVDVRDSKSSQSDVREARFQARWPLFCGEPHLTKIGASDLPMGRRGVSAILSSTSNCLVLFELQDCLSSGSNYQGTPSEQLILIETGARELRVVRRLPFLWMYHGEFRRPSKLIRLYQSHRSTSLAIDHRAWDIRLSARMMN